MRFNPTVDVSTQQKAFSLAIKGLIVVTDKCHSRPN